MFASVVGASEVQISGDEVGICMAAASVSTVAAAILPTAGTFPLKADRSGLFTDPVTEPPRNTPDIVTDERTGVGYTFHPDMSPEELQRGLDMLLENRKTFWYSDLRTLTGYTGSFPPMDTPFRDETVKCFAKRRRRSPKESEIIDMK